MKVMVGVILMLVLQELQSAALSVRLPPTPALWPGYSAPQCQEAEVLSPAWRRSEEDPTSLLLPDCGLSDLQHVTVDESQLCSHLVVFSQTSGDLISFPS